ncbi:hypothetical protein FRC01_007422 [Tulasnella sp. 417]|nr:hypothetical protein FRC01_007422 [Tulasnella sp. 417]
MSSSPSADIVPQPTSLYMNEGGFDDNAASGFSESSNWDRALIEVEVPETAVSLPPIDTGFDAYAYLVSAWMLELLVWSFPFSYGVFLNYYITVLFPPDDPQLNLLPVVGTLSSGIIYIGFLGLLLCVLGLVGAGFATRPVHLVVTQGVIYSIGGNLLYFPVLTYLMEWFSVKRGLANGILFTGTGLGGVVVPFITEVLLRRYGHKITFFILAAIFGGLALPAFVYAKPRLPVAQASATATLDKSFLKDQVFWVFFISNTIQAFANFLPGIYLPSFAKDLKLSTTSGTLALALMNATSVPGLIIMGVMSDKFDLRVSISVSTVGSALAILLVWGFTAELAPLLFFACLYGFFSSGFISVISTEDPRVHSTLMSLFASSRGLGNVLSGPLSTGLMRHSPFYDNVKYGYGVKGYGSLILFAGLGMLASTTAIAYPYFVGKTIDIEVPLSTISHPTERATREQS